MQRIENILFPVDFSDHSRLAAPAIAAMAKRFDSAVTLFHALDMPSGAYSDWQAFLTLVDVPALQRHEVRRLDRYLVEEMAGLRTHRVVGQGAAAKSIVDYARERGMDMIAMPTRGLSEFRALLLGAVTERVLHGAACPVWTEAHVELNAPPPLSYSSIVCAIDLSPASVSAMRWADRLAKEYGARLQMIHSSEEDWPEVRKFQQETYGRLREETGIEAPLEIVGGPVQRAVLESARRYQPDLLVIGRGHAQGRFGRLRTHAHGLIRGSSCPVLSV
jgi:nucleotide-binding universal stress UspA family protein